jgi:hypothetical protein
MNINPYDCVKFDVKDKMVNVEVDYYKYMNCLRTDNSNYLTNGYNKSQFREQVFGNTSQDIEFKGGTYEKLFEDRDLNLYSKYKIELKNNSFYQKIQEKLIKQNKRKRVFTDKDGDFDYDRRFDVAPYCSVIKAKVNKKVVDFYIHTGFSCAVSQETINKYAAIVCVLNDIFNTFGVSTNIYNIKRTNSISSAGYNTTAKIKIKDSGTYSTTQTILKNIDSVFYRRALFSLIILASDHVKQEVFGHLGQPHRHEKHFEFKDGEIHIYAGFHVDQHIDQFFKQLYEAI